MSTATPACGTDPDALLAQVAEGRGAERDAHQRGCPHCQATLAEYDRLWAPFGDLAAAPTPAPPGFADRALAAIRRQTGPPGWGRVADEGTTFLVAARAVVAVAGHAARTSAGVRTAVSALGEGTVVAAGVTGRSVAVDLRVAADYGHDLRALAGHLRARVVAEIRAQTGLEVVEVDVTITDVFPPLGGRPAPSP